MELYKITFIKSAQKQIEKLPQNVRSRVINAINKLSADPRPSGYTQLEDFELQNLPFEKLFRIRIGDYRAIYAIEDKIVTITVIRIKHRKEVYQ
jgi:mRNA interferase RelE/StbE